MVGVETRSSYGTVNSPETGLGVCRVGGVELCIA